MTRLQALFDNPSEGIRYRNPTTNAAIGCYAISERSMGCQRFSFTGEDCILESTFDIRVLKPPIISISREWFMANLGEVHRRCNGINKKRTQIHPRTRCLPTPLYEHLLRTILGETD